MSTQIFAQKIYDSAEEACPLKVGMEIPDAEVKNIDGETVNLKEHFSQKPTLLIFYRGSWCPYCNMHLAKLQAAEDEILRLGFQIIAVSPDRPEKLKASVERNNLTYSLFSDSKLNLISRMGLAFRMKEEKVKTYKEDYNIDLEADSGEDHHTLPVPAAYLVDKNGLVHFSYVNPNYKTRVNPEVILAAAESMLEEPPAGK